MVLERRTGQGHSRELRARAGLQGAAGAPGWWCGASGRKAEGGASGFQEGSCFRVEVRVGVEGYWLVDLAQPCLGTCLVTSRWGWWVVRKRGSAPGGGRRPV